jgi:Omp85 superfamily domain
MLNNYYKIVKLSLNKKSRKLKLCTFCGRIFFSWCNLQRYIDECRMKNCKKRLAAIIILLPLLVFGQPDTSKAFKKKTTVIFPVIARSIETGFSFGGAASTTFHLSKNDTATRTSNVQAIALYSVKKQFITAVEGSQYTKNEKFIFNEIISYSFFPDKFWGLGKDAIAANEESYVFKQYYVNLQVLKNVGHHFFVGGLLEVQNLLDIDYNKNGIFDKELVAGRRPYFIAGIGSSLTFDSRSNAFSPNKGLFAQLYFNHFDKYFGSDYIYSNVVVDVRKYLSFNQKVLALQAYYSGNYGDEIPLRSLASLGGSNRMRGYYEGRFRDKQLVTIQSELRFPIFKRLSGVAFGALGDVAEHLSDFSPLAFKYSYGTGLRFAVNKTEKLNIRIDYGFGAKGNSGLYFQLGEAF